jgi:hypothetical protein
LLLLKLGAAGLIPARPSFNLNSVEPAQNRSIKTFERMTERSFSSDGELALAKELDKNATQDVIQGILFGFTAS